VITNRNARYRLFGKVLYKMFREAPDQGGTFLGTTFWRFISSFHQELAWQYTPLLEVEKRLEGPMDVKAFLYFLAAGFQTPSPERPEPGDLEFGTISDHDPTAFTCLKVIQANLTRFDAAMLERYEFMASVSAPDPTRSGGGEGVPDGWLQSREFRGLEPDLPDDRWDGFRRFFLETPSGRLIQRFLDGGFRETFERLDADAWWNLVAHARAIGGEPGPIAAPEAVRPAADGLPAGEFPVTHVSWDLIRVFVKAGFRSVHGVFAPETAQDLEKTLF